MDNRTKHIGSVRREPVDEVAVIDIDIRSGGRRWRVVTSRLVSP